MKRARVLLADDHRRVAEALREILMVDFELVGTVEDGESLLIAAEQLQPDVIVADVSMPRLSGLSALPEIKRKNPNARVVLITMYDEPAFARLALEAGASGFVLKHSAQDQLNTAVHAALDGKIYVSPGIAPL